MPINQNLQLAPGLRLQRSNRVRLRALAPRGVLAVVGDDELEVEEALEARARSLPHKRIRMLMTGR